MFSAKVRDVEVRQTNAWDIRRLAKTLRKSDEIEVYLSTNLNPKKALMWSVKSSHSAYSVFYGDEVVAIFGIGATKGKHGIIWLLGSDKIPTRKCAFMKITHQFIRYCLEEFELLSNYVYENNKTTLAWLKRAGARFDNPVPFGVEQAPFIPFYFERKLT